MDFANGKQNEFEKKVFKFFKDDTEFNDMVKNSDYKRIDNVVDNKLIAEAKESFRAIFNESFVLPWMIGGLGTATLSNKSNAKSVKTCPLKCPTFNEAKKVS